MAPRTDQTTTSAPDESTESTLLRGLVRRSGTAHQEWSGALAVDIADPYFFDHPLDHLPGMALLCGLLELLRSVEGDVAPRPRPARVRLDLRFPGFCELDRPVRVTAAAPAGPAGETAEVTLRVSQDGTTVCEGTAGFGVDEPRTGKTRRRVTTGAGPADPALVHRWRSRNVLVSEAVTDDGDLVVAVRPPAAGHRLAAPSARLELVVDAARQFATMLHHVAHKGSADQSIILLEIDADLSRDLAGDLELRWEPMPTTRGRQRSTIRVVGGGVDRGHIDFRYQAVSPAVYQRLRYPVAPPDTPVAARNESPAVGHGLVGRHR